MAYSSNDYGDIFCQAVSNIVKSEVAKLEFDVSGEYTVIKINDKKYGKYQLSDGSIDFEAIAGEGDSYEVGDQVIATIPKGDYNKQVSILTKVNGEWDTPAGFVRPLDTVIRCAGYTALEAEAASLVANGTDQKKSILTLNDKTLFSFKKIGVSAEFKCPLENLSIIDGSYGLLFSFQKKTEESEYQPIFEFTFSSDEMVGNPYAFTTYFTQEYAFDLIEDKVKDADKLEIYFYQDGSFKDGNNNPFKSEGIENIFVKNIKVYFGYDSQITLTEIVEISSENLKYNNGSEEKNVNLKWHHKTSQYTMEEIKDGEELGEKKEYKINWYRYTPGIKEVDESSESKSELYYSDQDGGPNWELIKKDSFNLSFIPRLNRSTEKIKAVCFIKTYPLENDKTYSVWDKVTSNILTFENVDTETSGGEAFVEIAQSKYFLSFDDNSYGNYYLYDQNGSIVDSKQNSILRKLVLKYKDDEGEKDVDLDSHNITKIDWSINQSATWPLINKTDTETNKENVFEYTISRSLNSGLDSNAIIQCSIYINNQLSLVLQETLRFGKQGTSGTTTTFILEMLDGKNAVIINEEVTEGSYKGLKIQPLLRKNTGGYIPIDENKLSYKLLNNNYLINSKEENNIIHITTTQESVPQDNYTILEATYKSDEEPELKAYLPIPIKQNGYSYIDGATQVLYNHMGSPRYTTTPYEIYGNENSIEGVSWNISTPKEEGKEINPNYFELRNYSTGESALCAAALYSKLQTVPNEVDSIIQDRVCVYCKDGDNIIWSQPILIMQTQYDFAMLNSWDGSLTIDENNGTILSTMLGAGKKNKDNQFSGVLIGDIYGGSRLNDAETLTGIYGFQNGIATYGLKENGTAFFGAYGNGRIEFDGTSGIIRSSGWEQDKSGNWKLQSGNSGTLIDLDDGMLIMQGGNNSYFKFNADKDKSGKLEISLSGADIQLTDQDKNLDGYVSASIKAASDGIMTEVSRTANYACATESVKVGTSSWRSWKLSEISNKIGSIFQNGVTLAVTFHEGQEKEDIEHRIFIRDSKDNEKPVFFKNAIATSTGNNALIWDKGDTLFLSYSESISYGSYEGGWRVVDSGAYSKIQQTANEIALTVQDVSGDVGTLSIAVGDITTRVTTAEGNINTLSTNTAGITGTAIDRKGTSFAMHLDSDGFYLNKSATADSSNYVFKCDKDGVYINGGGTFSGELSAAKGTFSGELFADETKFKSLKAGDTIINSSKVDIITEYTVNNKGYKGEIIIGAPPTESWYGGWSDITMVARYLEGDYRTGGWGNIGTDNVKWDILAVDECRGVHSVAGNSARALKENLEYYNNLQAYEELKNMPLYTYKYNVRKGRTENLSLGTIIDYMPSELMVARGEKEEESFSITNTIFWHIGASQVMQKKIEDLEQQVQELQEVINNGTY